MATNKQLILGELDGFQKVAIFLLNVGEGFSTYFFQNLDKESIKKIGQCMSEISYVPSDVVDAVVNEFLSSFDNKQHLVVSGKDFFTKSAKGTLGEEVPVKEEMVPFEMLLKLPPENLNDAVKGEHPQTIALILSYLPESNAADVLKLLPENIKVEVAYRLTDLGDVSTEFIDDLDQTMRNSLSSAGTNTRQFDGVEVLASILNQVDGKTEESIISFLEKQDSELALSIKQKMFVFENFLDFDDKNFREILQNVDNQLLIKALKTASDELKEKVFQNLSQRAAEMMREDMEVMGPIRLSEVEGAQLEMLGVAKQMESEGRLVFPGKGKDDVLV